MKEAKVNREQALQELENWLDFKKVFGSKRTEYEDQEMTLVDNIEAGYLTVNEDNSLTYKLKVPIENEDGEVAREELKFKPRITVRDRNKYMKGIKPTDSEGRQIALVAALTGENKGIISHLYDEDWEVCSAIMLYFL